MTYNRHLEEFYHITDYDRCKLLYFYPFWERIDDDHYELDPVPLGLQGSYIIDSPK